ncbi:MAG: TolC family protein [Sphingomonas sp.]|uniref:TolC family protein n=1 Tax=Sphingomonas adhaesiva TaxID=28212 RepID=A0A2A4I8Y9_9SPHN|nr:MULTISPECIES: TolC family protein [Sphingomonas]PCG14252.1 TolC family protein [Sphingomonas adhaesiva]PZU76061.1 MAG: TolC family protein [Sphingomonas sp.]
MRFLPWSMLCIVAFASPAFTQDVLPLPLDYGAAQERLLHRSDAIEASAANIRSKEAQEGATRTLGRPDIDIEAQLLEYQKTLYLPLGSLAPVAEAFGIPDPLKFRQERTSTRPIVTATLPIYAGGQISGTQAGARAQVAQAKADRDIAIDDALVQLVRAYYGQQLAERALGIRRDVLDGLERHVADAVKLEQARFISRAQRLQAEVARDDAARDYAQAISDLATANAALAGILRAPAGVRPISPLGVDSQPLAPLATFKAAALDTHPQLARLRALEDQAEAGVKIQQSKLRPTIYGFGQYNFDRRNSLLTDPDWSIGVGLKYKLISGAGRQQQVEAARATVEQADAGLREARTQLDIGVTKAWNDVEAARKRFLLLDSALVSADENVRLQTLSYREQQATSLDVVDAQLGRGRARIQRAQAANDYVQALARLLSMSGQVDRMPEYLSRADKVIP